MAVNSNENRPGILFVDDEPILCELVKNMLKNQPYALFTATSPAEGLALIDRTPVDLVLSDYMMREMDGLEFLSRVRERQPSATRIIVTGYASMEVFIEAIKRGQVSRILHKPWDREEFLRVIKESISNNKVRVIHNTKEARYKQYAEEMERRVEERTRELGLLIDTLQTRNEKLEEMHNQLMQSDKMASLGLLAGTIAHDISNPLMVIKGTADLLKIREGLTEHEERMLNRISTQADRIEEFVSSIRNFSKQSSTVMKPVDLETSLREAILLTRHVLEKNEVHIETICQSESAFILGDPGRITQLLMNIIQNAAQAMPEGGEMICSVHEQSMSTDGKKVKAWEIKMADTGIGIPEDKLEKIFDAFYTSRKSGTGLGLNICKRVVSDHDGTITVESEVGKGSTFTITLPAYTLRTKDETTD